MKFFITAVSILLIISFLGQKIVWAQPNAYYYLRPRAIVERSVDQDVAIVTQHLESLMGNSEIYGKRSLLSLFPEWDYARNLNDRLIAQAMKLNAEWKPCVHEVDVDLYEKRTAPLWAHWDEMIREVNTPEIKQFLIVIKRELTQTIHRYVRHRNLWIQRIEQGQYTYRSDVKNIQRFLGEREGFPPGIKWIIIPSELKDRETAEALGKALFDFVFLPTHIEWHGDISILTFSPFEEEAVKDRDAFLNTLANIHVLEALDKMTDVIRGQVAEAATLERLILVLDHHIQDFFFLVGRNYLADESKVYTVRNAMHPVLGVELPEHVFRIAGLSRGAGKRFLESLRWYSPRFYNGDWPLETQGWGFAGYGYLKAKYLPMAIQPTHSAVFEKARRFLFPNGYVEGDILADFGSGYGRGMGLIALGLETERQPHQTILTHFYGVDILYETDQKEKMGWWLPPTGRVAKGDITDVQFLDRWCYKMLEAEGHTFNCAMAVNVLQHIPEEARNSFLGWLFKHIDLSGRVFISLNFDRAFSGSRDQVENSILAKVDSLGIKKGTDFQREGNHTFIEITLIPQLTHEVDEDLVDEDRTQHMLQLSILRPQAASERP
jgi:hypothetical protein